MFSVVIISSLFICVYAVCYPTNVCLASRSSKRETSYWFTCKNGSVYFEQFSNTECRSAWSSRQTSGIYYSCNKTCNAYAVVRTYKQQTPGTCHQNDPYEDNIYSTCCNGYRYIGSPKLLATCKSSQQVTLINPVRSDCSPHVVWSTDSITPGCHGNATDFKSYFEIKHCGYGDCNNFVTTTDVYPIATQNKINCAHGDSVECQCPQFTDRTPYLIIFISSSVSIWISTLIFWIQFKSTPTELEPYEATELEPYNNQNSWDIPNIDDKVKPRYQMVEKSTSKFGNSILPKSSVFDRLKSILLLIFTFYTITAFIINLYLDIKTVFVDDDGFKWICYIAIFSSSPNFKHLICSIILSPTIIIPISNKDSFSFYKKIRLYLLTILVFVPGFLCYLMPFLYCLIVIIITIIMAVIGGVICECRCEIGLPQLSDKQLEIVFKAFVLLIIGGIVLVMIYTGDYSVCIIHGYTKCTSWRLSWSEYMNKLDEEMNSLVRFITFMVDFYIV